jgi:hypothetical protein
MSPSKRITGWKEAGREIAFVPESILRGINIPTGIGLALGRASGSFRFRRTVSRSSASRLELEVPWIRSTSSRRSGAPSSAWARRTAGRSVARDRTEGGRGSTRASSRRSPRRSRDRIARARPRPLPESEGAVGGRVSGPLRVPPSTGFSARFRRRRTTSETCRGPSGWRSTLQPSPRGPGARAPGRFLLLQLRRSGRRKLRVGTSLARRSPGAQASRVALEKSRPRGGRSERAGALTLERRHLV